MSAGSSTALSTPYGENPPPFRGKDSGLGSSTWRKHLVKGKGRDTLCFSLFADGGKAREKKKKATASSTCCSSSDRPSYSFIFPSFFSFRCQALQYCIYSFFYIVAPGRWLSELVWCRLRGWHRDTWLPASMHPPPLGVGLTICPLIKVSAG
jgi:hypothetical protein